MFMHGHRYVVCMMIAMIHVTATESSRLFIFDVSIPCDQRMMIHDLCIMCRMFTLRVSCIRNSSTSEDFDPATIH